MSDIRFRLNTKKGPITGILTVSYGERYLIRVDGKMMRLLWEESWGPSLADAHGDPAKNQPGPCHAFWRAASLWNRQGRRTNGDEAIWHEPAPEIVRMTHRRGKEVFVEVIQRGEDPDYSETVFDEGTTCPTFERRDEDGL